MTRIDLRYLLVIAAFYAPGAMMALGALMLGFSVEEFRAPVAGIGAFCGAIVFGVCAITLFLDGGPIWWEFRK